MKSVNSFKVMPIALLGILVSTYVAYPAAKSGADVAAADDSVGGFCPLTINECNDPDGYVAGHQRVYVIWVGQSRCRGYFGGCANNVSRLCKTLYSVENCSVPDPNDPNATPISELACR